MSNLDDLRRELASRAGAVAGSHHTERMAGIRRKRTQQRRMTAAAAVAGAALAVVAAVALVPEDSLTTEPAPPPPATRPTENGGKPDQPGVIGVVEDNGVEFYDKSGGPLNGHAVGEPGQQQVEFSFVAGSDVLTYQPVCFGASRLGDELFVAISVNGVRVPSSGCTGSAPNAPFGAFLGRAGEIYEQYPQSWAEGYGVEAGARVDVVVELENGDQEPASDPDVVIGAAFWFVEQPENGHQVSSATVLPDLQTFRGVRYRYLTSVSLVQSLRQALLAPEHPPGTPVLVLWGADSGGTFTFYPGDSDSINSVVSQGPLRGDPELIRSGDTSGVFLRGRKLQERQVEVWIALYEPLE